MDKKLNYRIDQEEASGLIQRFQRVINADQVKCSHGSTSSNIDDEEIFYLRAHGILPHIARQLVAQGFSVEAISRLRDHALEEMVLSFAAREFHRISEQVAPRAH